MPRLNDLAQSWQALRRYPPWCLRPWYGMGLGAWLGMLRANRFAVRPGRVPMAILVTIAAMCNSALSARQRRRPLPAEVAAAVPDPIFILGHWRTGTTFLHELLQLDPRLRCPTNYQCFAPDHFPLTERWITRLPGLLPAQRPMDNISLSWGSPQEDELALCNLGLPSFYWRLAFPRLSGLAHLDSLDLDGWPEDRRRTWLDALRTFVARIGAGKGQRPVLKSPTHTGRIGWLARWFPDARFIHLVRHPYQVVPSTVHLWTTMDRAMALQHTPGTRLAGQVLEVFERMYRAFEAGRPGIGAGRIVHVTHPELARDPTTVLERIYHQLDLGEFAPLRERLAVHLAARARYTVRRYPLDPELQRAIRRVCGTYAAAYGFPL